MKDLKHLIYFERLLENADNELVGLTDSPVEILAAIPADNSFAANDIRGRSVLELDADSVMLKGVREALQKIEIL